MRSILHALRWAAIALIPCAAVGCDQPAGVDAGTPTAAPSASSQAVEADVLVTVNGVPIRASDLKYVLARDHRKKKGVPAAKAKEVLDELIEQELARQRAEELGFDEDPEYVRKLRFMEAPLNDFKRTALRDLYYAKHIGKQAKVDEAEAREHFKRNSELFKTEVRVFQILVRNDEAKIRAMKKELDEGAAFEEVAAQMFPKELPEGRKPWDMGYLRFDQVPAHFSHALENMKEGEVSGILRGPKNRAWILELVDRRINDAITFESVQAPLTEALQTAKTAELRKQATELLRNKAKIVHVREPAALPLPPEPE
jgi:EpsD family peptidyl-prolyl cis-trans isomerase